VTESPYIGTLRFEVWEWQDAEAVAWVAALTKEFGGLFAPGGTYSSQRPGRLLSAAVAVRENGGRVTA
jgi:hypothetical protein